MAVEAKKQPAAPAEEKQQPQVVDPRQDKLPVDPPKAEVPKLDDIPPAAKKEPALIAKLLSDAGITLYRERSGFPLSQAQRNLEGKSHYADDVSLRDYSGKILSCVSMDDGLTLGIVESYQGWPGKTEPPLYRPVFFDVFGNVVFKPSTEESKKSLKEAQAEFWRYASTVDPVDATFKGLDAKRGAIQQELDKVTSLLGVLKQ